MVLLGVDTAVRERLERELPPRVLRLACRIHQVVVIWTIS